MSADDIGNLVKTIGDVLLACLPIAFLFFKVDPEKVGPVTAQVTKIIAALAAAAVVVAGLWLHNAHSINLQTQKNADRQQTIEAVKVLTTVAPEHKEDRAKTMGIAPK